MALPTGRKEPEGPGEAASGPPSKKGGEAMTVMEVLTLLNLIATVILVAVTANKDSK